MARFAQITRKLKQAQYFDKRHRVKSLSRLDPGTEVQVSTYPEPGVILQETKSPRQYEVETPSGVIKRNQVQLVPLLPEGELNLKRLETIVK